MCRPCPCDGAPVIEADLRDMREQIEDQLRDLREQVERLSE